MRGLHPGKPASWRNISTFRFVRPGPPPSLVSGRGLSRAQTRDESCGTAAGKILTLFAVILRSGATKDWRLPLIPTRPAPKSTIQGSMTNHPTRVPCNKGMTFVRPPPSLPRPSENKERGEAAIKAGGLESQRLKSHAEGAPVPCSWGPGKLRTSIGRRSPRSSRISTGKLRLRLPPSPGDGPWIGSPCRLSGIDHAELRRPLPERQESVEPANLRGPGGA